MRLLIKNLAFTILVPGTVASYLPYSIGSRDVALTSLGPRRLILAAPALVAGAAIYLWCLWDFATAGRGTPAPIDPPTRLVVRGPYRYVRNPMYIGVLTVIAGWAALFRSAALLGYAAAVACVFHLVVLLIEEPQLRRRFGAEYDAYCDHVRRWLPGRPFRHAG